MIIVLCLYVPLVNSDGYFALAESGSLSISNFFYFTFYFYFLSTEPKSNLVGSVVFYLNKKYYNVT
jgi:hypothetical protein